MIDDRELKDLLLGTNDSILEIARSFEVQEQDVRRRIHELGMDWIVKQRRGTSRGHAALAAMMQRLSPGEEIHMEKPIGERLKLDVYCPKYKLGAEYHGRQHFEYVEHFHRDRAGFLDAQRRDARKATLCEEKGIGLIIFTYQDVLTEEVVFRRMLKAIEERPPAPTGDAGHLQRQRDWRRTLYQQRKAERKI